MDGRPASCRSRERSAWEEVPEAPRAPGSLPNMLVVLSLERGQVGFAVEEAEHISAPDGVRIVDVEAVVRGVLE